AAAEAPPAVRGLAPAGEPEGAGDAGTAPEGDLEGGDEGPDVGPIRLAARLAGPGVGDGAMRPGRADLAADRGAGRRQAEVRLQHPPGGAEAACGRWVWAEPLAGRTRLPADEGGAGAGPSRGPLVAGVPPPRVPGDAGLRVPHPGEATSPPGSPPAGQKGGGRGPVITLPAIRRGLQRLLAPISRPDCAYCRPWLAHSKTKLTE